MSAAVMPRGMGSRVITGVTEAKNRQTRTTDRGCQSSYIGSEELGTPLITPATVEEDKRPSSEEGEQMNSDCSPCQVEDNSSETFSSSYHVNRPTEGMKTASIVPKGSVECPQSESEMSSSCYPDMAVYGEYLKPLYQDGDVVLEVECGGNNGLLYLSKLCQGSKGPCIFFRDIWLTPNEFQYVSGRETAKDWKRSIRHHGKSMKLLLSKGILAVHPPDCDCRGCRISSPVNRGRLADKRVLGNPTQNGQVSPSDSLENSTEDRKEESDSPFASGYSDSVKDLRTLVQTTNTNNQVSLKKMDAVRKQIQGESTSPEPKRESRLTSIIDQLLSNKTKDMHQADGDSEKVCEDHVRKSTTSPPSQDNGSVTPANQDANGGVPVDADPLIVNCEKNSFDAVAQCEETDQRSSDNGVSNSPTRRSPWTLGDSSGGETQEKDHQGSSPEAQHDNNSITKSTELNCLPGTDYKASPGGGQRQLGISPFHSSLISRNNDMLPVSLGSVHVPVKTERLSPEFDYSSPSLSPHSPNPARTFPASISLGLGLRSAFPPSSPGLERYSSVGLACGVSALKQMEMMTRNYSDFMRGLAAKYNNQQNQESFGFVQPNGMSRPFESHLSYKSGTSPLMGRNSESSDSNSRKLENHKSSPILGENVTVPPNIGDFSSSQTLLHLVRTASEQSASQLENYLRGTNKRSLGSENGSDPLDLTTGTTKRPCLDSPNASLQRFNLYSPIARDIREAIGSLKSDAEAVTNSYNDNGSKVGVRKTPSWTNLLDGRLSRSENSPSGMSPKSSERWRCSSLCTDQSCSNKSDASEIAQWTVDDVARFVTSVESCAEYADNFRKQSIDGATVPLLSEDHLTTHLGMKLGPALKLRSALAKKIGHCEVCMHCIHCHSNEQEKRNDASAFGK